MLPWLGKTIAGTTEGPTPITDLPQPHENEISFILEAHTFIYWLTEGTLRLFECSSETL